MSCALFAKSVVGGFTVVLAVSPMGLWLATNRLWQSADETAKIQERDTRILQRAYVSVEPFGLTLLVDGSHLLGLVGIKNAGNLPARTLSWSIRKLASLNRGLDTLPSFDTKGRIVVAPHCETTRGSDGRLVIPDLLGMAGSCINRMDEEPV